MIINPYLVLPSVSYDPDAQAFFNAETAAGVTLTTTQKDAVNQWVVDAKAAGIWTKFKAVYPMVGGTATAHKFNLINPADTDAAFRLSFVGGLTHSANGILGNGTNGYANTFLNMASVFTSGTSSIGIYNRISNANVNPFIGSLQLVSGSNNNIVRIAYPSTTTLRHFNRSNGNTQQTNHTTTNTLGFAANSRQSNTSLQSINNTGNIQTNTTSVTIGYTSLNLFLFSENNNGSALSFSNGQLAFAYIADSLTSSELTTLRTINLTFQTTLGRNV